MRLLVTHPPDPRPALVVEIVRHVDEAAIEGVKRTLARLGCPNGLVFDADVCVILRDSYASLDAGSFVEDGRVGTERLLERVTSGPSLEQRVSDWLRWMAASWDDALPDEPEIATPFITDIVPAVLGSSIQVG